MHVENVSNYMYSKIKYSEHTNMIFFYIKRSQFHSFKRTCFNTLYKLNVYSIVIMIQNYFPDSLICKFDYYYSLIS